MARSSVYNVGEKKGLYCEGTNVVDPIEWINPEGKLVESRSAKNLRVYVERKSKEPNLAALIILSTKVKDTGNWTCQSGSLSETIEVVVGEKVVMPTNFEEVGSEEDKSVTLKCEAKGTPPVVLQWYKEGKVLEIAENPKKYKTKKENDVYSLEIRRLNHADAGEYMCKVTQKALSHYTHKIIKLDIRHRPILFDPESKEPFTETSRVEHVYAVLNETKNITCSAFGNPPPKFTWYRRNKGFDKPIRDDVIITSEVSMTSTLILGMKDEKDDGEYKCVATNDKGSVHTIFDVILAVKPTAPDNITKYIDEATGATSNSTHLFYKVTCENCTFSTDENSQDDPQNLPIIGYSFEVVEYKEGYPADWDGAEEFRVDIEDPEATRFDVGPLEKEKKYHVRVRSYSKAGFSDWLETEEISETSSSVRLISTVLPLIFAFVVMCY